MRLVIGLGNPGERYARTRHNVGFLALASLAGRHGIALSRARFASRMGEGRISGLKVVLAQPQTYMNLSGQAVRRLADYLDLAPADVLVLHDDMDVAWGRLKVVARGGHGGHKGVASLIAAWARDDFPRIKIGIGRPGPGVSAEDYVLSGFSPEEEEMIDQVVSQAAAAAEVVLTKGVAEAQALFHRKDLRQS